MGDAQRQFKIVITADAAGAVAASAQTSAALKKVGDDSERYNQRLEEMARRQDAETAAAKKTSEALDDQFKAAQRMAEVAERKALVDKETIAANEEIAKTVKVVGEEDVKAALASVEATDKTTKSKKYLKDAIKGLPPELSSLAMAGKAFLNPITVSVMAIVGAFVIWRRRVQELTNALAQAKLSDSEILDGKKINAVKGEWEAYGKAVDAAKDKLFGLAAQHDAALKKIETFFDLVRRLGGEGPITDEREVKARLGELSGAAFSAQVTADRKHAEAMRLSAFLQNTSASNPEERASLRDALEKQIAELEAGVKTKSDFIKNDPRNAATFWGRLHWGGDAAVDVAKQTLPEDKEILAARRRALASMDRHDEGIAKAKQRLAELLKEEVEQRERAAQLNRQFAEQRQQFMLDQNIRLLDGRRPMSFRPYPQQVGVSVPGLPFNVAVPTGVLPGTGIATLNTGEKIGVTPSGKGDSLVAAWIPLLTQAFRAVDEERAETKRRLAAVEGRTKNQR